MIEKMREISFRKCFLDCAKVVVEFPAAFYNPKFSSGSLSPLAAVSGACMSLFQDTAKNKVFPVYPTVWNGHKKKEKMAEIIQKLIGNFSEWEFDEVPTRAADSEHVIDAVGMAYWLCEKEYFESYSNELLDENKKVKAKKSGLNL